jgi:AcrR family transcriptional regulator
VRTPPDERTAGSKASILRSARHEIAENGILGLRVAEVAAGANCSITQIYRYFGDRNGLLARVLGDMYEEVVCGSTQAYQAAIFAHDVITVDILVDALPPMFQVNSAANQGVRLQILAASVTNEPLRRRLEEITQAEIDAWEEGLDEVERRLAPGERFDRRVFTMILATQLPYYRNLMGDKGFTAEDFRQFLRDKMSS